MFNRIIKLSKSIVCTLCFITAFSLAIPGFDCAVVYATESLDTSDSDSDSDSESEEEIEFGKNGVGNVYTKMSPANKSVYNIKYTYSEEPYELIDLSGDDITALLEGKDIDLVLYAQKFTIPDAVDIDTSLLDQIRYNSLISEEKPRFISYLDFKLYKEIDGETPVKEQLTESKVPINFTFKVPNPNYPVGEGKVRYYYLCAQHETDTFMFGPYGISNGHINVDIQSFTTFALFFVDLPVVGATPSEPPKQPTFSYNKPPTSAEEIKEKIEAMVTPIPVQEVVYIPTISPDYNVEETSVVLEPAPTPTVKGKSSSISFKTLLMVLVFLDLLMVLGFYLFLSHRGKLKR